MRYGYLVGLALFTAGLVVFVGSWIMTRAVEIPNDRVIKATTNREELWASKEALIRIPTIGVESAIREADLGKYKEALRLGVWRMPNWGMPGDRGKPLVLVAHRFGYLNWSNDYRRKHSFYNLPKVQKGDGIEVVWQGVVYRYVIIEGDTGVDGKDLGADLVLFTCKQLWGDERVFRYGKLVEMSRASK